MIPRAIRRRLETTLLSSRQSLPRPARLYTTSSKRVNAPALATAERRPDYPPAFDQHQVQGQKQLNEDISSSQLQKTQLPYNLESFLSRSPRYTIIPPPLPRDRTSVVNDLWYTDSTTQDLLAVMDACLQNLYDVSRAQNIFNRLRSLGNPRVAETRVYNAFLEAFIKMATEKEPSYRAYWICSAWDLFEIMENGTDGVSPDAGTYANMLQAWQRFNPDSDLPVIVPNVVLPVDLLSLMVMRKIPAPQVVINRVYNSTEAAAAIKILSKAAVKLNFSDIVKQLGQAETAGQLPGDILDGVPEVIPVRVVREKEKTEVITTGEAKQTDAAPEPESGSVSEIPFNLDNLRRHLANVTLARRVLPEDVAARQKLLEESVYEVAMERLKHESDLFASIGLDATNNLMRNDIKRWMWDWHQKLKAKLEVEISSIVKAEENDPPKHHVAALGPYLLLVNAERLSLITILEIMRLQGSGGLNDGMKTTRALLAVGMGVEIEYKAQMCKKHNIQIPTTPARASGSSDVKFFSEFGYRNLHERRVAAAQHMMDGEGWTAGWTQAVRSKVGGILVDCMMDTAEVTRTAISKETGEMISEVHPAFFHSYEYQRGQKLGVIRLNTVVSDRLAKDGVRETLHPRHLPMLIQPKPWLSYNEGGYLYNKTQAMRFKDSVEQQTYLRQADQLGNVELVYAGLDVLGSTPWVINRKVFDVVLEVWNSGKRLGKLPPAVYDEPEPVKPDNWEIDLKARSIYLLRQKVYSQNRASNHSERCGVNYKIEIARAFLGDTFYMPHNLDFRGRAYPIPPHLSHIGDDLSRGLLTFAEARPLGEKGLQWLKIHLANLYGFDKANFQERVEFVENQLDDVFDSATNPLTGGRWWTKADDPWQCLATCMELHAALNSPSPTEFESSLPVHQDGTCNGLQHYAALGGDDRGAQQVNLARGDRPSDVYTYVGNMVEKRLSEDINSGDEYHAKYASLLLGKITRKVVKQTVMTTVYGVTFIGAREQIEKQLKDRKDLPQEECWLAASYLAKRTLECIGDLFIGATAIQNWLNLCARLISKSIPADRVPDLLTPTLPKRRTTKSNNKGASRLKKEQMTSVVWTTPLGLPIVQPYRKVTRKQIMTNVQTVYITDPNSPAEVNAIKQASAFPPNFIHSLDATHMMLTALECKTKGITFASVHDSYWTHASHIDEMSVVIRDTFIALHSSDVLGKMHDEFVERYKDYKIPLVSLRTGQLPKLLRDAGTRIKCTPEQAKRLAVIKDIVEVVDTNDEEKTISITSIKPFGSVEADIAAAGQSISEEEEVEEEEEEEEEFDDEFDEEELDEEPDEDINDAWDAAPPPPPVSAKKATKKPAKKGKSKKGGKSKGESARNLNSTFVNLVDLIPPLPKKGSFKVEDIKESLYFFS